jgi:lysozyme
MATLTVPQQRAKVWAILAAKITASTYVSADYILDNLCRELLGLPSRGEGAMPYVRWMEPPSDSQKSKQTAKYTLSKAGIELIKRFEGLRTNAYRCPAGVWTIGYGHTRTAKPGMMISHQQAEELLKKDLSFFEDAVTRLVKVPLTQGQYDALVSFAYNCGVEALRVSSLLRYLNKGEYNLAALQFSRWTRANGKVLPGLVSRRADEYELFKG